jgi:hypothetical protein
LPLDENFLQAFLLDGHPGAGGLGHPLCEFYQVFSHGLRILQGGRFSPYFGARKINNLAAVEASLPRSPAGGPLVDHPRRAIGSRPPRGGRHEVPSVVNLHNAVTVSQQHLGKRVAQIISARMNEVCAALRFSLGCDAT